MCSIGHDLERDVPLRQRRHADGTHSRMLAETPRTELQRRRAAVKASLQASKDAREADELAEQHGQLELMPPDMAQLPASSFKTKPLPDPSSLWYSSAREE